MKHWNFRIVEFDGGHGEPAWRELREVFYDDAGQPGAYGAVGQVAWDAEEDPQVPYAILERMRAALDKPILFARDFNPVPEPLSNKARASFTVVVEQDPASDGVVVPLPDSLLADLDWRIGDRIRIEVLPDGRMALTNLSKTERGA
jgi:hypothetical protein